MSKFVESDRNQSGSGVIRNTFVLYNVETH